MGGDSPRKDMGPIWERHPIYLLDSGDFRLVSSRFLVEILLETGEDLADFFGAAEVGNGVGDGIVVFEAEQGG